MKTPLAIGVLCVLTMLLSACGGSKQSTVEGKLVDWNGNGVEGIKITATQVQPIKGYEQFETETKANGTFRIQGLFPSSQYVLKPSAHTWTCDTAVEFESAPLGEIRVFSSPMQINQAHDLDGELVRDLTTGSTRYWVSSDGVITDSQTDLEWVIGPDESRNYAQAEQWVTACKLDGGGWRMPTRKELESLYQKYPSGVVRRDYLDWAFGPAILLSVWAEPNDASSAWVFYFELGEGHSTDRSDSETFRLFGVRSRP